MKSKIPNGFSAYRVWSNGVIESRYETIRDLNGRFKRRIGSKWKPLKMKKCSGGYLQCSMTNDDKKVKYKKPHRLVAELFLENPEKKPEVNHIDGNKVNNCISNLEWVTKKENTKHAVDNKLYKPRIGKNSPNSKLNDEIVLTIRSMPSLSNVELSKKYNCSTTVISNARRGVTWKHLPMP